MSPRAWLEGGYIYVDSGWRGRSLIRQVPGARWDPKRRYWRLKLAYATAVQLSKVFGGALDIDPKLSQWAITEWHKKMDLFTLRTEGTLSGRAKDELAKHGWTLDRYGREPMQEHGAAWLAASRAAILADDMGTGKTLQCVAALIELEPTEPCLVVCPKSAMTTWEQHLERSPFEPVPIVGSAAKRRKLLEGLERNQVALITWQSMTTHTRLSGYGNIKLSDKDKQDKELNRPWGVLIADEAHRAKDPKARQTRALWQVSLWASYRWALTGTPVNNHPADLWSILHTVSPDEWPVKSQYVDRYCDVEFDPWGHMAITGIQARNREEFWGLIDPHFLRRRLAEVMSRDIKVVRSVRRVELAPAWKRVYKALDKKMVAELPSGDILAVEEHLAKHGRLRQLAQAGLTADGDGWTMVEPSPKIDELVSLLDDLEGEQVIVFSASAQLIKLCQERFKGVEGLTWTTIDGSCTHEERELAQRDFQSGAARVILLTTGAGSETLTLTAATKMVYICRDYSLKNNSQGEARHARVTQESDVVHVIDIVTDDTLDAEAFDAYMDKLAMANEVTRDDMEALDD